VPDRRPEPLIVHAVALLHDRGLEGVRIRANHYATGHWRCRVYVPSPGDDPDAEPNVLLAYTNGRGFDIFGDGREGWDAASLTDELARLAASVPVASRPDAAYAAWLRELRRQTGGGHFSMYEDFSSPEDDWESRRLVRLIPVERHPDRVEEWAIRLPPAP
jgi:hypothetical protein